jgi:hypothetical protein
MKLFDVATGRLLQVGDAVQTFRDETCTLTGMTPPRRVPSTGRVKLRFDNGWEMEYYPGVIGAKFWEEPVKRFRTSDGYLLFLIGALWVDAIDPEAVDLDQTFNADAADGWPIDAFNERLEGRYLEERE